MILVCKQTELEKEFKQFSPIAGALFGQHWRGQKSDLETIKNFSHRAISLLEILKKTEDDIAFVELLKAVESLHINDHKKDLIAFKEKIDHWLALDQQWKKHG